MKVLIDIQEEMFKATQTYYSDNTTRLSIKNVIEKIANGTPISNNATNGDMIKAMFPNQTIGCAIPITDRNGVKFYRTTINGVTDFTEDWWNALYKRGDLDGSN